MTPNEQEAADKIEEDRKRHEAELLLLLALLFGQAIRYSGAAIRLGHDPNYAARAVILGDARLGLPGMQPATARMLATAHEDGARQAFTLLGDEPNWASGVVAEAAKPIYLTIANKTAEGMADTFTRRIGQAIAEFPPDTMARKQASQVEKAMQEGGYGKPDPYILRTVTEKLVVDSSNAGMMDGGARNPGLWGYEFSAVLDKATTVICRTLNGTRMPKDSDWFQTRTPSCHWGCRSILSPIKVGSKKAVATPNPPTIQAAPGFGRPWYGFGLPNAA